MLYQFLSLPDKTEISYSEIIKNINDKDVMRVYIERWNESRNDFDSLEIYIPEMIITKKKGYSHDEINQHLRHINNLKDVIWECALERTEIDA